jgi:hypothetical protein
MIAPNSITARTHCLFAVVGVRYSHMTTYLLRQCCNIVMPDNASTAYRDATPGRDALPLVAVKSTSSRAPRWKSARFDLKNIADDDWKCEEKDGSQEGCA